ncbi:MAG TPA: nuclear transport factor 2 family protein [Terriglobia bacterium]|nr:nuclear transport factor 2 family protein [Terriglobia bacterium]
MILVKNQDGQGAASEQIEAALHQHWEASAAGNQDIEHEIYDEHAVCDYPQSGERIHGKRNLQNLRSHHPGKPTGFSIRRLLGSGELWITEYTITYQGRSFYTVSIMEFENGKVVHETQYFAEPFDPPGWRAQWVEQVGTGRRA